MLKHRKPASFIKYQWVIATIISDSVFRSCSISLYRHSHPIISVTDILFDCSIPFYKRCTIITTILCFFPISLVTFEGIKTIIFSFWHTDIFFSNKELESAWSCAHVWFSIPYFYYFNCSSLAFVFKIILKSDGLTNRSLKISFISLFHMVSPRFVWKLSIIKIVSMPLNQICLLNSFCWLNFMF